jgi:V/A-type H+-transporting ATPase subunit F
VKIWVVGHPEAVQGFSLVGVEGRSVTEASAAKQALDEALGQADVGIVLVTHDMAEWIGARMDELKLQATVPLVVEIPGPAGVSQDQPSLSEVIRRAVGVKI